MLHEYRNGNLRWESTSGKEVSVNRMTDLHLLKAYNKIITKIAYNEMDNVPPCSILRAWKIILEEEATKRKLNIKSMEKTNEFFSKINGSTFCPGSQEKIKTLNPGDLLMLKREPENKFDPNAVAVYANEQQRLGYVPKETAVGLSKQIDTPGTIVKVVVSEVTGRDKANVGCNIKIEIYGGEK